MDKDKLFGDVSPRCQNFDSNTCLRIGLEAYVKSNNVLRLHKNKPSFNFGDNTGSCVWKGRFARGQLGLHGCKSSVPVASSSSGQDEDTRPLQDLNEVKF